MKILLTGSSGFIGRNLKETWMDRYDLIVPTRQELDLLDAGAVERFLKAGQFDIVFHTANTNQTRRPISEYQILDCNLRMFYNLERCREEYGKLYYFGSGAEYDLRHYIPQMPESYFGRHIPQDPYGLSKYTMSKLADGNIYDFRLFGVFGKYEEWRRRFISNMIYQNFTGSEMKINQNMYFDYLYIDDLVRIMEWFLAHEPRHHHYNVCTGTRIDLLTLAQLVNQETGIFAKIIINQDGWKSEYSGNNDRLRAEIGDLQLTPIKAAVQELIAYYRKAGFPSY